MTAGLQTGAESLVERYLARSGMFGPAATRRYDEVTGTAGSMLPGWAEIAGAIDAIGSAGLAGLSQLVDRLLEDDGVTYTPVSPGAKPVKNDATAIRPQRWQLDPVPLLVDAGDWARLESGLLQRSLLLDAVLTDIYSARSVLTSGLLPPALVFEHDHYLRQAHGIRIPGAHQLFFHAVDVCRGPDGAFQALGDRTQAPSGAGYAMADRRIVSRVLPELFRRSAPRGLGNFFHSIRGSLQAVAPTGAEDPRVVVLSPGTHSETAFDQAFLASLLGLPLVESADLTVRGGRLWMRALGRYEPVDVVLRRVDAAWSDPLDLRPDSQLGVVGLTEACRRGTVTVVNSLGSGVLENPGLLPYLPALCRELLGEELKLQSVPTFWCGAEVDRAYVLAHFDEMVLRPTGRGSSVVPALLSRADRDLWKARVLARPTQWVGQVRAQFSEAPVVGADGLAPQRVGMRVFTVAHQSGYVAMPGGLGRVVSDEPTESAPSRENTPGPSVAKDIWVRSVRSEPSSAEPISLLDSGPLVEPVEMAAAASPRVLEDLFWLGRYDLVGLGARNRHADVATERGEAAAERQLLFHQHAGRCAVRQLRGVACSHRAAFDHRLEALQPLQRRVGAIAFVLGQRHLLGGDFLGFLVDDVHRRGDRDDLVVELAGGLGGGGALLRLEAVGVADVARDVVALGHDLGGLEHRHVDVLVDRDELGVAADAHLRRLDHRDALDAAADRDVHAVDDDLLRGGGDRHQAGRALAVERHARDAGRQAGTEQCQAGDVAALDALLERGAHHDVLHLGAVDAGALDGGLDRVAGERGGGEVVEGAAIGAADRGAGGGHDDG